MCIRDSAPTGWGTQAIDANLDSWPDLVATNGHVDDHRERGGPYKMSPQFFLNRAGHFEELIPQELGGWFKKKFLGRGLARIDWNMDGHPEFVVSNIGDPASLLTNKSTDVGNQISVRLHATTTSRDALGTRLRIVRNDVTNERQLYGGDGVMACNERLVQFGLGAASTIDRLEIEWPSGAQSVVNNPTINSVLTITEGLTTATVSSNQELSSIEVGVTTK